MGHDDDWNHSDIEQYLFKDESSEDGIRIRLGVVLFRLTLFDHIIPALFVILSKRFLLWRTDIPINGSRWLCSQTVGLRRHPDLFLWLWRTRWLWKSSTRRGLRRCCGLCCYGGPGRSGCRIKRSQQSQTSLAQPPFSTLFPIVRSFVD